jgi:hypothetical protein
LKRDLLAVPVREGAFAPQGRIAADIFVRDEAIADDVELVQAVVDYVNRLRNECLLTPGEYPEEADWSYYADYYLSQVNNGGHRQYAHNSGLAPAALRDCRLGLQAMGALDYLAIFDEFLEIVSEEKTGPDEALPEGLLPHDPRFDPLDKRFFALKDMLARNAAWLRTLSLLKPLPPAELDARFASLLAANARYRERQAENEAARRAYESEDPSYSAAHACAALEGATLERLTAGSFIDPAGQAGVEWGAYCSNGFRTLTIYWGDHAEWRDKERALKAIYHYDTRGSYPDIAGSGEARAEVVKDRAAYQAPAAAQLGEFYFLPLADMAKSLHRKGQIGALIVAGTGTRQSAYVPREAARSFNASQPHAQFRLFVATMLYDLTVHEIRHAGHSAALNADNDACAIMAASCALAAAGAASIRLLEPGQIGELARRAPDDLMREQINVLTQLREISDWQRLAIRALAQDIRREERRQGWAILRPSFLERARKLLQAGEYARKLNDRLAYFDAEYPRLPADQARDVMLKTIAAVENAEGRQGRLLRTVRVFEMIDNEPGGHEGDTLVARMAEPGQFGATSKADLVPNILVVGPGGPAAVRGGVAFDFDHRGDRLALIK